MAQRESRQQDKLGTINKTLTKPETVIKMSSKLMCSCCHTQRSMEENKLNCPE